MRVETMLRKEKDGSLFKDTKLAAMRDELMKIAEGTPVGQLVNEGKDQLSPAYPIRGRREVPTLTSPEGSDPPAPPEDSVPETTQGGELTKLQSIFHGFFKLAQSVSRMEAEDALRRLRKLERDAPTAGELSRNALAGAAVMPVMGTVSGLVSGKQPLQEQLRLFREGAATAAPTRRAAWKKGISGTGRGMLASAVSGVALGAGMPLVRGYLHREAEKEKLRDYLGVSKRGKLRGKVKKQLGV